MHTSPDHKDNIPAELREHVAWLLWKYEPINGQPKPAKVPYTPKGDRASVSDPATWSTFEAVIGAYERIGSYDGLGLVLQGDIGAIDIDDCIGPDGDLSEMARDIVKTMDSYTEISPSGKGLRIFFIAPGFSYDKVRFYLKNSSIGLEVYIAKATKRYLTVTGDSLSNWPIAERAEQLTAVLEAYMQRSEKQQKGPAGAGCSILTDEEVIEKALLAANGARFEALVSGDTKGYASHSEADQGLCNYLAFWCGGDKDQMDRLFRVSGLYREKWEREDYREATLEKAIRGCDEFYGVRDAAADFAALDVAPPNESVRPLDFSDAGNAQVFQRVFNERAIYVKSIGWLIWDGKRWVDNELYARKLALKLTDWMLTEARKDLQAAGDQLTGAEIEEESDQAQAAKDKKKLAEAYRKHAKASRSAARINGMLNLAQALLQILPERLDADPYMLNTPDGIVDLRDGRILPHDPKQYCSKITAYGPSPEGAELWKDFLEVIAQGDAELLVFLRHVAGMSTIGAVFEENLIVALGDGKNGKSVCYNTQACVLGDYAGTLAAEVLTTANKSKGAELATLKGKRLVIAAETEEGARLAPGIVKQLTSTDKVHAERKYKDPEDFTPTHTLILYTNHLPRVGSMDSGIWRRLVPAPFKAKIEASKEIKNYASVLAREAGGAVLSWMIQGAKEFIAAGHRLSRPDAVQCAIEQYRNANDWAGQFLEERCRLGPGLTCVAGDLYTTYRYWAETVGEYKRSSSDFKAELERRGYLCRRTKRGVCWFGFEIGRGDAVTTGVCEYNSS